MLPVIFSFQIMLSMLMAGFFFYGWVNPEVEVGSLAFALIFGAMGASISLVKRMKKPDLNLHEQLLTERFQDHPWDNLIGAAMPLLYGTILSGIAYLLFMSGILSGDNGGGLLTTNLFPSFVLKEGCTDPGLIGAFKCTFPGGIDEAAKLLVWCFLAGYSEKFVANILDQLESKTSN